MTGEKGTPLIQVGEPGNKKSATYLVKAYLEWMRVRGYSEHTLHARRYALSFFLKWCDERELVRLSDITMPILERYQRNLFRYRKKDGKPLSFAAQRARLVNLQQFFKWLTRQHHILYNPASELVLPKKLRPMPKSILSAKEVEKILSVPDLKQPIELRDRVIMEVFYSTGIRRMELANLKIYDVDRARRLLAIRMGKGQKDRMVPIGKRALLWVTRYLEQVRHLWSTGSGYDDSQAFLFLSHLGTQLDVGYLSHRIRSYIQKADIGKTGSCHLFRHSMATLMLDNGADIRFIQVMLGHSNISSTQIYTQVSMRQLQQIHEATHPAKMGRSQKASDGDATGTSTAEELLLAIEAEGEEELREG